MAMPSIDELKSMLARGELPVPAGTTWEQIERQTEERFRILIAAAMGLDFERVTVRVMDVGMEAYARKLAGPRAIREAAGLSQVQVAARSNTAPQTVRLYEADPDAVSRSSRKALDTFYAAIAEKGKGRA